jgi:hypothetical protein
VITNEQRYATCQRNNYKKTQLFKKIKEEKRKMKGNMVSGFLRRGLPVVGLILLGILLHGAVNFVDAKATPSSNFGENEVEWRQIVGIIVPGSTVGTGTGKVTGGGLPWHTSGGHAEVNLTTGAVRFDVDGLVLAAGNSIGTPDGVTSVKGTLVCDTTGVLNSTNSTLVDTPLVILSAQGNANFRGSLGTLPVACTSQPNIAFLIRTGGGAWLASGMVRVAETDNDLR